MKDMKIASLKDMSIDIVKEVGVIEFLEKEITLKKKSIEINEKEQYYSLVAVEERELERLVDKKETIITSLELFDNLTWKDGNLYKMENFLATTEEYSQEDHEEWERKQKDPNENGGVL
mgnify:CR=1 FL=1